MRGTTIPMYHDTVVRSRDLEELIAALLTAVMLLCACCAGLTGVLLKCKLICWLVATSMFRAKLLGKCC